MPKAVTKSLSRCSSRSSRSSRSSCHKRRSPRDNLLSSIREALRSSPSCTKRSNIVKRESPKLQRPVPMIPKIKEKTPEPEVKITETKPGEKAIRGLIEHGIRYIMLPLHLFNFCVWGSPNQSAPNSKPEVSSEKVEVKKNVKQRNPSPASSTSGFSSCSSNFSKNSLATIKSKETSEVPEKIKAPSPVTSGVSQEKSKSEIPQIAEKLQRISHIDSDDSTDEMVTADEYFDDSSNERWSSAESSTSMNMSIDIEGYNNGLERFSSRIENDDNSSMEEPMDVSMEESSVYIKQSIQTRSPIVNRCRSNNSKKIAEKKSTDRVSSSSCSEERESSDPQDFSSSSADREIGRIFARASISLSSSDEESSINGRRNNPFVTSETIRKRTSLTEDKNEPRNVRSKKSNDREISRSPKRSPNSARNNRYAKRIDRDFPKVSNQTDSAYSDEDVEMNSIHESYMQNLHNQSFAMPNHRVIEWMEQDLDYVADAEDSNDASPILEKATISSTKNSSQLDKSPEKLKKNRGASRRIFPAEGSNDDTRSVISARGPPGFPNMPQHPSCTNCHCGNPKCFFLPVSADFPMNESANKNYPRAPSPLRHLYYEYPEFMSPPRETIVEKKPPYVLVPASLVLP